MQPYKHRIQYYETDQMACVHHSNYIRWFEEARTDFMEQMGFGYDRMEQEGIQCPVLKAEAEYKSMSRFGETVSIQVSLGAYTGTRVEFLYEVEDLQTAVLRCVGKTSHCFINQSGRPVSLKKALPLLHELMQAQAAEKA